ncbi:hypothetical protein FRC11_012251 [Ceratobasidium sp. 423]|nr:hypothetical protein FRC11_012251 [Ceratobasidium sp. 423]
MPTPRAVAIRSARVSLRFAPHPQFHGARFNSTRADSDVTHKARDSAISISHIISGLIGGSAVIFSGYLFYHFSGIKPAVDTVVNVSNNLKTAKTRIKESFSPSNQALSYIRSIAKAHVAFIPGGSWAVDSIFDLTDELHSTRRKEIDSIIFDAYNDIKKITDKRGSMNVGSLLAILGVLRRRVGELGKVAGKASSDAVSPILKRYPGLRDALGGKWGEFRDFARSHGPETQRVYNDAENKIINTVESKGVNAASIATIVRIVRDKSGEAKRVAENTSWDAWDHARKQAGSAWQRMPDVRKVLDDDASSLTKFGGSIATMSSIHARKAWGLVKQTADSTGRVSGNKFSEFKKFISKKVGPAERGEK